MATTTRATAGKPAGTTAGKAARKTTARKAGSAAGKRSSGSGGAARKAVADAGSAADTAGKAAREGASATEGGRGGVALPTFADFGKLVGRMKLPGIDVAALVETQKKDMEALAEANRQAYDGIRALAKRRSEILREALGEWQEAMKDATGKDAMSKNAERARQGVQQAIDRFRELAEMEAETRRKSWKVLQDRFQENLASLQALLKAK